MTFMQSGESLVLWVVLAVQGQGPGGFGHRLQEVLDRVGGEDRPHGHSRREGHPLPRRLRQEEEEEGGGRTGGGGGAGRRREEGRGGGA